MKARSIRLAALGIFLLFFGVQCNFLSSLGGPSPSPQTPLNNQAPPVNQQPQQPGFDQQPEPLVPPENIPPENQNPPENQKPPAQFKLTGIWESQTNTDFGIVYTELILEPTKTFSQQVVLNDLMTYDVGTYEDGEGFIHFVVEDHQPKEYKGQPMHWVTSFTYFYTVVDENTMILEDRIIGTRWTINRRQ
jgi:hypothetical protein